VMLVHRANFRLVSLVSVDTDTRNPSFVINSQSLMSNFVSPVSLDIDCKSLSVILLHRNCVRFGNAVVLYSAFSGVSKD
jgi:hypothetical protein